MATLFSRYRPPSQNDQGVPIVGGDSSDVGSNVAYGQNNDDSDEDYTGGGFYGTPAAQSPPTPPNPNAQTSSVPSVASAPPPQAQGAPPPPQRPAQSPYAVKVQKVLEDRAAMQRPALPPPSIWRQIAGSLAGAVASGVMGNRPTGQALGQTIQQDIQYGPKAVQGQRQYDQQVADADTQLTALGKGADALGKESVRRSTELKNTADARELNNKANPHFGLVPVDPTKIPDSYKTVFRPEPDGSIWMPRQDAQALEKTLNTPIILKEGEVALDPVTRQPIASVAPKVAPVNNAVELFIRQHPEATAADVMKFEIDSKAEPASAAKQGFQRTLSKLGTSLPAKAITDSNVLASTINQSGLLSPQEKSDAIAYLVANPSPATAGTTATIRMEGYGQARELVVLDTKNNNTPMYLNANEINAANSREPGRYLPAGIGAPALKQTALIEDIRGNLQSVRNSLAAVPEFTPADKIKIAMAMKSRDPSSAISSLIASGTAGSMTPEQQDYLINHAQLVENAMAMRSVLGAGQGSDDLRSAIQATIPGPTTPNKTYAAHQLDQFEKVLNRLERGVPKVPLRNDTGGEAQNISADHKPPPFPAVLSQSDVGKTYLNKAGQPVTIKEVSPDGKHFK